MKNEMVRLMATVCCLAAVTSAGFGQQSASELGGPYNGFVNHSQQSIDYGWVPRGDINENRSVIERDAPRGFLPEPGTKEAERRESIRRTYRGRFEFPRTDYDPYTILTTGTQTTFEDGSCSLGDKCPVPKHIHDQGHCQRNICIMISASWCNPCQKMYPLVQKLRKEGYIFYVFDVSKDEFKNYDAKFNVESVPTFLVFDKGIEVTRTVGETTEKWFRDTMKTRKEQDSKPLNPYDGI